MDSEISASAHPHFTWSGLTEGARRTFVLVPGTIIFAAAFGTLAAQKGLSLTEAVLMSTLVFSGTAQLVSMEVWQEPLSLGVILSLGLVTIIANMRFVLIGASLRPWLGSLPTWQSYGSLSVSTDANWLIGTRYRAEGGSDVSILLGSGLLLWGVWVFATVPGYLIGALIADPKRFGLDLVMPAFFVAMLVPLWRGPRHAVPWIVAGIFALMVSWIVPGWWFIIAGALAGALAGGFVNDD